jgi:hypothetical protein
MKNRWLASLVALVLLAVTPCPSHAGEEATVYTVAGSTQYHLASCLRLNGWGEPVALADAARRYRPCPICRPPSVTSAILPTGDSGLADPAMAVAMVPATPADDPEPGTRRSRALLQGIVIGAEIGLALGAAVAGGRGRSRRSAASRSTSPASGVQDEPQQAESAATAGPPLGRRWTDRARLAAMQQTLRELPRH